MLFIILSAPSFSLSFTANINMSRVVIFLVCVLAMLGMTHALTVEGSEEQGTILLHKTVTQEYPGYYGEGINFTVKVDLHNLGEGSAFNVTASDNWPSEHFEIVEGSMNATFEEIAA